MRADEIKAIEAQLQREFDSIPWESWRKADPVSAWSKRTELQERIESFRHMHEDMARKERSEQPSTQIVRNEQPKASDYASPRGERRGYIPVEDSSVEDAAERIYGLL